MTSACDKNNDDALDTAHECVYCTPKGTLVTQSYETTCDECHTFVEQPWYLGGRPLCNVCYEFYTTCFV